MADVERRACAYGLPAVVWPEPWPTSYLAAMRAATYAFALGRGREFTLQAYRDGFARGRDLGLLENVLSAAAASGLERREVVRAVEDPAIKRALRERTESAHELGVVGVPTVIVDGRAYWGDDRLEEVAHVLGRARREGG